VDELAKLALFAEDHCCDGTVRWQQWNEEAVGPTEGPEGGGHGRLGRWRGPLYLPNNDGSAVLPVTSNVRRTLLRDGLQRERLSRWANSDKRAKDMVTGIRQGEMKVLSSAARAAWGRHMQHPRRSWRRRWQHCLGSASMCRPPA
jgi:hypothetical protein